MLERLARTAFGVLVAVSMLTGCGTATDQDARPTAKGSGGFGGDRSQRYEIFTHCGPRFVRVDGETWETDARSKKATSRVEWPNSFLVGELSIVDKDTAVFSSPGYPDLTFEPSNRSKPAGCA
jgi:ABC-type glycerol-3-phosphate transport system substrate-binding protein